MKTKICYETHKGCNGDYCSEVQLEVLAPYKGTNRYPLGVKHDEGAWTIIAEANTEGTAKRIAARYNAEHALRKALEEIADRGPVAGYNSAGALKLRLVATQSIARAALALSKSS